MQRQNISTGTKWEQKAKYRHFAEKRRRMEEIERRNIEERIEARGPSL